MLRGWLIAALVGGLVWAQGTAENCTFQRDPDEFLTRQQRAIGEVNARVAAFGGKRDARMAAATGRAISAGELSRYNFIDDEILGRLEKDGIPVARRTTDAEFVRRIYLDLAGRIPTPAEYRGFLETSSAGKRDELIERLLNSPDYVNRWSTWLADLVQNTRTAVNVNQNISGRNKMYDFLRNAIWTGKSFREIVWELTATVGNNYDIGPVNWQVRSITPGGPAQDRYDTAMVRLTTAFLGLGHYDCLACHNGRGHLELVSAWGAGVPRMEAYRMSAFFSRMNVIGRSLPNTDFYSGSFDVTDRAAGTYDLNTNYGNRPSRVRLNNLINLTPEYRDGKIPAAGISWRAAFADFLVADPMFGKNMANRVWKQLFQLALAEPVDGLDPARLDPDTLPPAPWARQTAHPVLLKKLGEHFASTDFNLRELIRTIVSSTTYQLSSQYDGEWNIDYVPLFARHYPRRLEGEEIHDILSQASGNWANYSPQGFGSPVQSAWLFPDPTEPGGNTGTLLATFLRGNRDTQPRRQDGSILQSLTLMNDVVVRDRIRSSTSPNVRALVSWADTGAIVEQLFLLYLGREPNDTERAKATALFARAATTALKTQTIEDLAWVLVNKIDFQVCY